MKHFLDLLDLNENLKLKLADLKAVYFKEDNEKKLKVTFNPTSRISPNDLYHLLKGREHFIEKSKDKFNWPLEQIFITQIYIPLVEKEFFVYLLKLVEAFVPEIKINDIKIKRKDRLFYIKAVNEKVYDFLKENEVIINKLLKNINLSSRGFKLFIEDEIPEPLTHQTKKQDITELSERQTSASKIPSADKRFSNIKNSVKNNRKLDSSITENQKKVYFEGKVVKIVDRVVNTKFGTKKTIKYLVFNRGTDEIIYVNRWIDVDSDIDIQNGQFIKFFGDWVYDAYNKFYILKIQEKNSFEVFESIDNTTEIIDSYNDKRSELHIHTKMSAMDGVNSIEDYINHARKLKINSLTVTDHNSLQSYPLISKLQSNDLKINYGVQLDVINDIDLKIVWNEKDQNLKSPTYIFFDLETTGISPLINKPIEFGAVKWREGHIIEELQFFIDPGEKINSNITELTGITNADLKDAISVFDAMKKIKKWFKDSVLVAHNAKFDLNFINSFFIRCGIKPVENIVIDTLGISRLVNKTLKNHRLSTVVKHDGYTYDDNSLHRADYDAMLLCKVFENMLIKLSSEGIKNVLDLNKNVYKIKNHQFPISVNLIAKNQAGIKKLFELVSVAHIDQFNELKKTPSISLSYLLENKKDLLMGSSLQNGLIWDSVVNDLHNVEKHFSYFDYIEISPIDTYINLINKKFYTPIEIVKIVKKIAYIADKNKNILVVTSDAHYTEKDNKIIRDIYIANKGVGMRFHPLYNYRNPLLPNPNQHLRTTSELMEEFTKIFNEKYAKKIVITNTNLINSKINSNLEITKKKLYTPIIANSRETIESIMADKLKNLYGDKPNQLILDRIKKEWDSILGNKYDVIYYLSYLATKESLRNGFPVGSRGSVGSSIVARLLDITEVNPLQPHYLCEKCKNHYFVKDVDSGYDLSEITCEECNGIMKGEGQNLPFEIFMGFKGEKVPDIDLNFAREYQLTMHKYIQDYLGENNVYRAGTISTVANRTAYGFIKKYLEILGKEDEFTPAKIDYLSTKVEGGRRTNGQHPGGLIIVPKSMSIYDFTPINFPGNDVKSPWKTTHFDFHSIDTNLLKLDFLGHLNPSILRKLVNLTGFDSNNINMNDKDVIKLFRSSEPLNYKHHYLKQDLGVLGIPEFGTKFVFNILEVTRPQKFSDLVKVSGLSHGTQVWSGNAKKYMEEENKTIDEVISTRDDILIYLTSKGVDNLVAFEIMEAVRKGKGITEKQEKLMLKHNIENWYINSCRKIQYIFPKAHATAYVIMAFKIAWYKINYPLEYYATYFSIRDTEWNLDILWSHPKEMIKFKEANKISYPSERERLMFENLEIILEMYSRGYKIEKINLDKSLSHDWVVNKKTKSLIPPFSIIDGLGKTSAIKIVEERDKKKFSNINDFISRTNLNAPLINKFKTLNLFTKITKELEDFNQIKFSW